MNRENVRSANIALKALHSLMFDITKPDISCTLEVLLGVSCVSRYLKIF